MKASLRENSQFRFFEPFPYLLFLGLTKDNFLIMTFAKSVFVLEKINLTALKESAMNVEPLNILSSTKIVCVFVKIVTLAKNFVNQQIDA